MRNNRFITEVSNQLKRKLEDLDDEVIDHAGKLMFDITNISVEPDLDQLLLKRPRCPLPPFEESEPVDDFYPTQTPLLDLSQFSPSLYEMSPIVQSPPSPSPPLVIPVVITELEPAPETASLLVTPAVTRNIASSFFTIKDPDFSKYQSDRKPCWISDSSNDINVRSMKFRTIISGYCIPSYIRFVHHGVEHLWKGGYIYKVDDGENVDVEVVEHDGIRYVLVDHAMYMS